MTTNVDIVNRALQSIGTRTTIASLGESSNEAIQASLVYAQLRDQLLRMAPWTCANNYANLSLITATPGTPENTTAATTAWAKGQPPPPWAYEYQYPVDCMASMFVIPQFTTGFASSVPITTAVTGGAPSFWLGPPQKFIVAIDQFYPVTAAAVVAGGTGHAVGDLITLENVDADVIPIGAPAVLLVATVAAGVILTATVVNQIAGASPAQGGSYFLPQTNPIAQGSTTGSGTGATFNLTFGAQGDQRVILTNQEAAAMSYAKQITDPNVMDPGFVEAWVNIIGARLALALTGDKGLANLKIKEANELIKQARQDDANEGLTVNDVTPDWIRARGITYPSSSDPISAYDWGPMFSVYG